MPALIFWGKPGCIGNRRQLALLAANAIEVDLRDLLSTRWDLADLRGFFGDLPVARWFNLSAPMVRDGEVRPETLSEEEALRWMQQHPLLIRRPLMQWGELRQSGFDDGPVMQALGLNQAAHHQLEHCPVKGAAE